MGLDGIVVVVPSLAKIKNKKKFKNQRCLLQKLSKQLSLALVQVGKGFITLMEHLPSVRLCAAKVSH